MKKTFLSTCGTKQVTLTDAQSGEVKWAVNPGEHDDLPEDERSWIAWYHNSTDECKPAFENSKLLVTSVAGLAALIDISTKRLNRIAWMPGAHSAEMIDDYLCVVAVAEAPGAFPPGAPRMEGDYLCLYDIRKPGRQIWKDHFHAAHGAIWDERRQVLWALGYQELREYRLMKNRKGLEKTGSVTIPDYWGHDLSRVTGEDVLNFTTWNAVWRFDCSSRAIHGHPVLGEFAGVKGISENPESSRVNYTQADTGTCYTNLIRFTDGSNPIPCSGVYKARWCTLPQDSIATH